MHAKRLDQMGTNGLVLFNRFYQPDIDSGRTGNQTERAAQHPA
jgi:hypothetical protein